jgi:hypothetical protein
LARRAAAWLLLCLALASAFISGAAQAVPRHRQWHSATRNISWRNACALLRAIKARWRGINGGAA